MPLGFYSTAQAQSRVPITIENNSGAPLINHSIRVELNASNAPGFDFSNNGDDLLAANFDFTTALDFFVESVNPVTEIAVIWIEVPLVPVSPPNTSVFLDYNRSDVTTPRSDIAATFPEDGFLFHTQQNTAPNPGPESFAEAEAAFDFDTVAAPGSGYGCTNIDVFPQSGATVDNSGNFGSNVNIAYFFETFFSVPADGLYGFRIGPDYGQGGELYLDDVTLEEAWTDELFWGFNYASSDVLQGTRFLTAGTHSLNSLGFELCCDGFIGLQYIFDSDGDGDLSDETFSDLNPSSPGISIFSPSCPVANVILEPVTTVPVTLAKFTSKQIGPFLNLEWETADETFNAGFDFWTLSDAISSEGELSQLNTKLIRSKQFDSLATQFYKHRITLPDDVDNIVISSVDISGQQEFFGPFEIGETYGSDTQSELIDWPSLQQEFERSMREKGFVRNKLGWRKKRSAGNQNATASALLTVSQDGLHRVTHEQLLEAGIDLTGIRKNTIAVMNDSRGIPRRIGGKGRLFTQDSFIDFVGVTPQGDKQIYAVNSIYEIGVNRELALSAPSLKRRPENPQNWRYKNVTFDEDKEYIVSSPAESPWFTDVIFRSSNPVNKKYDFQIGDISKLAPSASQIKLQVAGLSSLPGIDLNEDGAVDPDHLLEVFLNETLVTSLAFEGQVAITKTITVPTELLIEGTNTIKLVAADNGYIFDATGIDSVSIDYPVFDSVAEFSQVSGEFDGLIFDKAAGQKLYAYAYRLDGNLAHLAVRKVPKQPNKYHISFTANGGSQIFLGSSTDFQRAESIEKKARPNTISLVDSDMLVISHPHFLGDSLDNYLQQRYVSGVSSLVVSTADIADNYGVDIPLHEAIKRFLVEADTAIEYEHVLIVGGHSYDYRNIQNKEAINFIPTFYRAIGFSRFTPSDQPFVDFDNDGFPEKTIGRWPVRSSSDLNAIVQKSLIWAQQSKEREKNGHRVLLMADRERVLDFGTDLETQFSLIKTNDLELQSTQRVYVDDYDATVSGEVLNTTVQQDVAQSIKDGASWLIYNGHGSRFSWSATSMLNSQSISRLENTDTPFAVTSLACYTTYYEEPSNNTLAHQLMFGSTNGAAIVHGPAVVGGYDNQLMLSQRIIDHTDSSASIGQAVYRGMKSLPVNYANAILNWTLLADPTLPVQ